ncbi:MULTISPECIES: hypothetical protein [unclassified Novosphingobium]|uniref:hypothetical protein n=1 Tax=unclassified Novosphingobium TaxID=2644732 RepID=UPI00135BEC05|nr:MULTISPECIES: hypothetical protein [unclassified Novosphingobium]
MRNVLTGREQIEAQIAGNLENLIEALRLPADYPARDEYLNMVIAKGAVLIAQRNLCFVERLAA